MQALDVVRLERSRASSPTVVSRSSAWKSIRVMAAGARGSRRPRRGRSVRNMERRRTPLDVLTAAEAGRRRSVRLLRFARESGKGGVRVDGGGRGVHADEHLAASCRFCAQRVQCRVHDGRGVRRRRGVLRRLVLRGELGADVLRRCAERHVYKPRRQRQLRLVRKRMQRFNQLRRRPPLHLRSGCSVLAWWLWWSAVLVLTAGDSRRSLSGVERPIASEGFGETVLVRLTTTALFARVESR
jgi:hypothetical protein